LKKIGAVIGIKYFIHCLHFSMISRNNVPATVQKYILKKIPEKKKVFKPGKTCSFYA